MIQVELAGVKTPIVGEDATEIVTTLQEMDWTKFKDKEAYKANMAQRLIKFGSMVIQYTNDMEFLKELRRVGIIENLVEQPSLPI